MNRFKIKLSEKIHEIIHFWSLKSVKDRNKNAMLEMTSNYDDSNGWTAAHKLYYTVYYTAYNNKYGKNWNGFIFSS